MASVTARVELHGATERDYQNLHAAMQQEGYARSVLADDNKRYHLPPGEYAHYNVTSLDDARARAVRAAARTGRASAIFVAGWDGAWVGQGLATG